MHAPFRHYRGTIGDLVYRKVRGKTIVALKRDADLPLKQGEAAHRQDFAEAATWATTALKDDELRQLYEELGEERNIPARAAAVSDFLKPPSIEGLDLSDYAGQAGNKIYFMATDNVGVINAPVKITDPAGTLFENGAAVEVEENMGYWMYTSTSTIPAGTQAVVSVLVSDRPKRIAEMTEEKAL
jgi:hypothetical protein